MQLDGEKVRRGRLLLGYGAQTAADVASVSKNSFLRAERGDDLRPGTARKIAQALGVPLAELLEDDSPKGSRSSLEPSFDDVLGDERREREQLLVSLMVSFLERGKRLEEALKATTDSIPLAAVDEYAQNKAALQISYEEMASKGGVSKRLEEASQDLNALDARIKAQFEQLWSPSDVEHLLQRGQFAGRRAGTAHGEELIGEANIAGEAG